MVGTLGQRRWFMSSSDLMDSSGVLARKSRVWRGISRTYTAVRNLVCVLVFRRVIHNSRLCCVSVALIFSRDNGICHDDETSVWSLWQKLLCMDDLDPHRKLVNSAAGSHTPVKTLSPGRSKRPNKLGEVWGSRPGILHGLMF